MSKVAYSTTAMNLLRLHAHARETERMRSARSSTAHCRPISSLKLEVTSWASARAWRKRASTRRVVDFTTTTTTPPSCFSERFQSIACVRRPRPTSWRDDESGRARGARTLFRVVRAIITRGARVPEGNAHARNSTLL